MAEKSCNIRDLNSTGENEDQESPGREEKLRFQRFFTTEGISPYEEVEWETRTALIAGENATKVFEQKEVEVPKNWSQAATNIVASKYFHGQLGTAEREYSVRQLISRVVDTIRVWGERDGYFADEPSASIFAAELTHLLLNQKASFNSPVWFNCGIEAKPQCSACFINSVEDSMESILQLAHTEGMLFKWGSGSGTNLSCLRSSQESISGGGKASGPVSFMKGFDAFAGVIKSGGKTRRAAKMVILNVDHPDILDFIWCKAKEEKKAWVLIDQGYDGSLDGDVYNNIFFQNANNSVRVTDEFMKASVENRDWHTLSVTGGDVVGTYPAREILRQIAEATHHCGDPGIQFDSTINRWHTCKQSGRINASNPCSEYMFLDDSACNLSSLNLMKYIDGQGNFNTDAFTHAVDVMITAQEIIVSNAGYPTERIADHSEKFRPLGLGYANLGALLMNAGLPYDSEAGRHYASAVTALMTGQAYTSSARIAAVKGAFAEYDRNSESMLDVIGMHRDAVKRINHALIPNNIYQAARQAWDKALEAGREHGFRNAQVTVLAPTGTIGFMMDCDTTGIEPDLALVKEKKLVGGGKMRIVNNTVSSALGKLGYTPFQTQEIVRYVDRQGTIEGAPGLRTEHLPVFDCAFKPANGSRCIHYLGHLKMMAAVQPFLSGAISKTVNVPKETSPEAIMNLYIEGWRMGIKAVAVYRDTSKRVQPLTTLGSQKKIAETHKPVRRKLPNERRSITHKFRIAEHEGYITVGMHEDGTLGELFVVMAKEGSTISGIMDAFATSISLALQYGVPLKVLIDKFSHSRYEPSGYTGNPEVPFAKSITDYIFRWLASKFLKPEERKQYGIQAVGEKSELTPPRPAGIEEPAPAINRVVDGEFCPNCGSFMIPNGSCHSCTNCGTTTGCS